MPSYLLVNGAQDFFGSLVSSTSYQPVSGGGNINNATIAQSQALVRASYTWKLFQSRVSVNTSTNTSTLATMKNSVAGTQTMAWTSTQTGQKQDTTHTDSLVSGDLIQYRLVISTAMSTSTTFSTYASVLQTASADAPPDIADGPPAFALTSSSPVFPLGWTQAYYSLETAKQVKFKESATLSNFRLYMVTNAATVASTIVLRKNTATANQTLTWGVGVTGALEDTTHTDSVGSGDLLNFSLTAGGTGGNLGISVYQFLSSGKVLIEGGGIGGVIAGGTSYFPINGRGPSTASTTESPEQVLATLAAHYGNFQLNIQTNGLTVTATADVRVNATSTGTPSLSPTAGQTGLLEDTSTDLSLAGTEQINYRAVAAAGSGNVSWTVSVQSPLGISAPPGTFTPGKLSLTLSPKVPTVAVGPKAVIGLRSLVLTPKVPLVNARLATIGTKNLFVTPRYPGVFVGNPANLVTNGEFEAATPAMFAGWLDGNGATTLLGEGFEAHGGQKSLIARYGGTGVTLLAQYAITLTAVSHTLSIWLDIPFSWGAGGGGQVEAALSGFTSAVGTPNALANMSLVDTFQNLIVTLTPDASDLSGIIAVSVTGALPPANRNVYIDSVVLLAAAPPTGVATPGKLSLVLTSFQPTVAAPRLATVGTKALVLTRLTPTVSAPRLVTPGKLSLLLTRFAPAALAPRLAIPGKLALTLTPRTPNVLAPRLTIPGKASLVLTSFGPNVTASALKVAIPGTRALVLTGLAPTVVTPRLATLGTKALVLTRFAPNVSVTTGSAILATPGKASLVITPKAPAAIAPRLVIPAPRALVLTRFLPSVLAPRLVVPGTRALLTNRFVPNIGLSNNQVSSPITRALLLTRFAPNVTASLANVVVPGTKALVLTRFAPLALAPRLAVPGTLALVLTRFTPSAGSPRLVVPGIKALLITRLVPSVIRSLNVLVSPITRALLLTRFAPAALAPRLAVPGKLALLLTRFVPSVGSPRLATPPTKALVINRFVPNVGVSNNIVISPNTRALLLVGFIPLIALPSRATVSTRNLLLTAFALRVVISHREAEISNILKLVAGEGLVRLTGAAGGPLLLWASEEIKLAGDVDAPLVLAGNTGPVNVDAPSRWEVGPWP